MNQLTPGRILSILTAILGSLMVANTQLTDLFGAYWTTKITSASALGVMILGSVGASVTGPTTQDQAVRRVLDMPGVENIAVNGRASAELAKLAVDPLLDKIAPTPAAQTKVEATANAA